MSRRPRALIVGLGIGGLSAALSLHRAGWQTQIIERAQERRTGGYFVGLFPQGKCAARQLDVMDLIHMRTAVGSDTWDVRADGSRIFSSGFLDQPGRPEGVLRSDIEAGLWAAIKDRVPVRFGTVPIEIRDRGTVAEVLLRDVASGTEVEESFDLVVGADGLRSTVRELAFGSHRHFMKPMNAMICALQLDQQVDGFRPRDGVMLVEPRRALWVFPLADCAPTALFTWRTRDIDAQFTASPQKVLRQTFGDMPAHGILDEVLDQVEDGRDCLFDSVWQVRMPRFYQGRVVILGDAAWCPSLYSGMGATLAMKGAAILGEVLSAGGSAVQAALANYQTIMRPIIRRQQIGAFFKREFFVPSNGPMADARRFLMQRGGRRIVKQRAADNSATTSLASV